MPSYKDEEIFNPGERILMIKEFFYAEDQELWQDYVNIDERARMELEVFGPENLESTRSDELKNCSTKSLVLAPFNSTGSDSEDGDDDGDAFL